MQLFFYASEQSNDAEAYAEKLLSKKPLQSLSILPAGKQLKSDHSLKLRNGDIMILFAATHLELDKLLAINRIFNEFRVVLVLKRQENPDILSNIHILKPRFITFTNSAIGNLEDVITKMQNRAGNSTATNPLLTN